MVIVAYDPNYPITNEILRKQENYLPYVTSTVGTWEEQEAVRVQAAKEKEKVEKSWVVMALVVGLIVITRG
jgi:hypothetical protein